MTLYPSSLLGWCASYQECARQLSFNVWVSRFFEENPRTIKNNRSFIHFEYLKQSPKTDFFIHYFIHPVKKLLNDQRKLFGLRKSEVWVERISVCNAN